MRFSITRRILSFRVKSPLSLHAGVDHFHTTIELLASSPQMLAKLDSMEDDPEHLRQLFGVGEEQARELEFDPGEYDPFYVDPSDIEEADDTENAVDNAIRLFELFKFALDEPYTTEQDFLFVHQLEIDQAEEVEDGERLGQLESQEAQIRWATPTMEELTNYYLGPSRVSDFLIFLFLHC